MDTAIFRVFKQTRIHINSNGVFSIKIDDNLDFQKISFSFSGFLLIYSLGKNTIENEYKWETKIISLLNKQIFAPRPKKFYRISILNNDDILLEELEQVLE